MKKGLLGILAVGMITTAADAGTLSLRFAGGGTEITMDAATQSATIEVVMTFAATDTAKNRVTGFDARFDVGGLVPGVGGDYVLDGSTKFAVAGIQPTNTAWTAAASDPLGSAFNRSYFLSMGDPAGLAGPTGGTGAEVVLGSFDIHKTSFVEGDTYIVFRHEDPLIAVYNGPNSWGNRFQYSTTPAQTFRYGTGNPGDADPRFLYHGYETLSALVIHNVPEPSALALLALGGLAMLRRRS